MDNNDEILAGLVQHTRDVAARHQEAEIERLRKAVESALYWLTTDSVRNNSHRMGLFGQEDVERAVSLLQDAQDTSAPLKPKETEGYAIDG